MGQTRPQVTRDLELLVLSSGLNVGVRLAEVLVILMDHPEGLTSARLCYLCNPHRPAGLGALQERISALRKVMGRDAIGGYRTPAERQAPGGGKFSPVVYSLSDEGRRQCREAMRQAADSLRLRFDQTAVA
jgi:hypothetical protein